MTLNKFIAIPVAVMLVALTGFGAVGTAEAQTVMPRLGIELLNSGLTSPLDAGDEDATVARLVLDTSASTEAVRISNLPFSLNTGNGGDAETLENCVVVNEANGNELSDPVASLDEGLNRIDLDNDLILAPNTITVLAFECDVDAGLEEGATFTFSMNTANVNATGATTGVAALVYVRGAVVPPVVVPPIFVPGLPVTGAEDNVAENLAIIFGSLAIAGAGLAYSRKYATRA